jgi:hypothetical protein
VTRLLLGLGVLAAASFLILSGPVPAADPPDTAGAKATREKKLKAKLDADLEKKMLRELIKDLQTVAKDQTKLTLKIVTDPKGITLTSSFGPFKSGMTIEEILNAICDDRSWGWYVNSTKVGDQNDGAIFLTTNSKQRGYKEGAGPDAKKEDPKSKTKPKDKSKE